MRPFFREVTVICIDPVLIPRTIRMSRLLPKIVHRILSGELDFKIGWLEKGLPILWEEQEKKFLGE